MIVEMGLLFQRPEKRMDLNDLERKFCIAPMMEWTDRHCRFFHRLLTRCALIYTEMISTGAVLRGPRARLMAYDAAERPVALQLGGCDPRQLAECARIAEEFGYAEVNLNIGCPSDRVLDGRTCSRRRVRCGNGGCGQAAHHSEMPDRDRRSRPRGGARSPRLRG